MADLTWDGTHLWAISRSPQQICKFTTDGFLVTSIPIETSFPYGLTWDGSHLWYADYITDKLYRIVPGAQAASPDFDYDGDVDGMDLWEFIGRYGDDGFGISIQAFAASFGK